MSYTNKTKNLELPQWLGSDKPNWDIDLNEAFKKIDDNAGQTAENISGVAGDVGELEGTISALQGEVTSMSDNVDLLGTRVTSLESSQASQDSSISKLNTDVAGMSTTLSGIDSTVSGLSTQTALNTQNIANLSTSKISKDDILNNLTTGEIVLYARSTSSTGTGYVSINKDLVDMATKHGTSFFDETKVHPTGFDVLISYTEQTTGNTILNNYLYSETFSMGSSPAKTKPSTNKLLELISGMWGAYKNSGAGATFVFDLHTNGKSTYISNNLPVEIQVTVSGINYDGTNLTASDVTFSTLNTGATIAARYLSVSNNYMFYNESSSTK